MNILYKYGRNCDTCKLPSHLNPIVYEYLCQAAWADPEGGQGSGPPPPLKNHKNIGFLSNTGWNPL